MWASFGHHFQCSFLLRFRFSLKSCRCVCKMSYMLYAHMFAVQRSEVVDAHMPKRGAAINSKCRQWRHAWRFKLDESAFWFLAREDSFLDITVPSQHPVLIPDQVVRLLLAAVDSGNVCLQYFSCGNITFWKDYRTREIFFQIKRVCKTRFEANELLLIVPVHVQLAQWRPFGERILRRWTRAMILTMRDQLLFLSISLSRNSSF